MLVCKLLEPLVARHRVVVGAPTSIEVLHVLVDHFLGDLETLGDLHTLGQHEVLGELDSLLECHTVG